MCYRRLETVVLRRPGGSAFFFTVSTQIVKKNIFVVRFRIVQVS